MSTPLPYRFYADEHGFVRHPDGALVGLPAAEENARQTLAEFAEFSVGRQFPGMSCSVVEPDGESYYRVRVAAP